MFYCFLTKVIWDIDETMVFASISYLFFVQLQYFIQLNVCGLYCETSVSSTMQTVIFLL